MASLGDFPFTPREFSLRMMANTRTNAAPGGGSEQTIDLLNDRWIATMTLPARKHDQAAALEAFIASLRGMVNTVNIWHFRRPTPRGGLSGSVLTSGTQAQGASSLTLTGVSGGAIYAGDMLGLGGMLVMASADATPSGGNITVSLSNRLRSSVATGQAVTLTKPSVPMRLMSTDAGVNLIPGSAQEVMLTFGEVIA